jgi:hypothetical protein
MTCDARLLQLPELQQLDEQPGLRNDRDLLVLPFLRAPVTEQVADVDGEPLRELAEPKKPLGVPWEARARQPSGAAENTTLRIRSAGARRAPRRPRLPLRRAARRPRDRLAGGVDRGRRVDRSGGGGHPPNYIAPLHVHHDDDEARL